MNDIDTEFSHIQTLLFVILELENRQLQILNCDNITATYFFFVICYKYNYALCQF